VIKLAFIGGFLAVVGLIILGRVVYERRRRAALVMAADDLGFTYDRSGTPRCRPLAHVELFRKGRRRRSFNLVAGAIEDIDVELFDYRYTTGSGKNSSTYNQTVCAMRIPGRDLPAFELRPESVFTRIASAMGFQDIDFDTHPEFSRRYVLRGKSEESVRMLFTDDRLRFFEGFTDKLAIEGGGEWILIYRHRQRTRPDKLSQLMETAFEISAQFDEPGTS
jgi:hypothetical protein